MQRRFGMERARIEDTARHPFTEASVLFKPDLRRGFELQGENKAGNAHHIVADSEGSDQFGEPVSIDHHIVIGKSHNSTSGHCNTAVTRPGDALTLLAQIAHTRIIAVVLANKVSGSAGG